MEWLYGASETSNMEVDIGYIPQVNTQCPSPDMFS